MSRILNPSQLPTYLRSLLYGYAIVILLLLIAGVGFIQYSHLIKTKLQQADQRYQQLSLIDAHVKFARERVAVLTKMLNTQDIFELDSLQQQMYQLEHQIGQVRQQLARTLSTPQEQALFHQTQPLIQANKQAQFQVYQLLMNDQKERALQVLTQKTLPYQEQVFATLFQIKSNLKTQLDQQKQHLQQTLSWMENLVILATLVPIFAIILIGFLTSRRLYQQEQAQQAFQSQLETALQRRTEELQLDASIFQQINEAIAVSDLEGNLIKTNPLFQELLQQAHLPQGAQQHTLWHLLQNLFHIQQITHIQQQVQRHQFWREEVRLQETEQYFLLTLSTIHLPNDPKTYLNLVLSDFSEIKFFQQKLEQLATTDAITGLHNRHALNQYLQTHLTQKQHPFTLFNFDLDHFKAINDHLGHDEGDRLLQNIGQTLQAIFLPYEQGGICCRVGGDEFILCLPKALSDQQISHYCEQLLQNTHQFPLAWQKLGFGISMGIARYPQDGQDAQTILRHADYAMYHAKQTGKNHYIIFDKTLKQQIDHLHQMEEHIKIALNTQQFEVYFQPQINLNTLQLCGAEALLRWPTKDGMISPAEFIPLAEKFDLINELGHFVLEQSVKTFCQWQNHDTPLPRIAINVSAIQISTSQLGPAVKEVLRTYPIHPKQIDFEITESVLMDSTQNRYPCLSFLENLGSEISIDDFGTGYSSLAYIQNIQADRIKIDRSFVQGMAPQNTAYNIVKAIIQMAHSLGLKVLAEGIETQEQLMLLKELQCDEGQGFFFNQALTASQFEKAYLS